MSGGKIKYVLPNANGWYPIETASVNDRDDVEDVWVTCFRKDGRNWGRRVTRVLRNERKWETHDGDPIEFKVILAEYRITHWRPTPKPPING